MQVTATLAERLNCTKYGFQSVRACLLAASGDDLVYAQGVHCVTPNACSAATSWSPTIDGTRPPTEMRALLPSLLLLPGHGPERAPCRPDARAGVMLPDEPLTLAESGKVNPVAVALGANTNDSYLFIMSTSQRPRTSLLHLLVASPLFAPSPSTHTARLQLPRLALSPLRPALAHPPWEQTRGRSRAQPTSQRSRRPLAATRRSPRRLSLSTRRSPIAPPTTSH